MADRGKEILEKRMNLRNLLDQVAEKQKDLKRLNEEIENETRELKLLEMIQKVNEAMEDFENYPKDFKEGLKTWSRKRLKILYSDMDDEEIDMLYERMHMNKKDIKKDV